MNINDYLRHINLIPSSGTPNIGDLVSIQRNHLLSVPFENLDIHIKGSIDINQESLFNKIVLRNRGGICYELNYLVHILLKVLGYDIKLMSANVLDGNNQFDHLFNCVNINNVDYLVDVGFGDNFLEPLRMEADLFQQDKKGLFVLRKEKDIWSLLKKESTGFSVQYRFLYKERNISDFSRRIEWMCSSEESIFTHSFFTSLEREQGRLSLSSKRFVNSVGNNRTETLLPDFETYRSLLNTEFGIDLRSMEYETLRKKFDRKHTKG